MSDYVYSRYRDGCFFCNSYKEDFGVFYKNRTFYSRFDRYPVTPGHCEIIPSTHIESIIELSTVEFSDLKSAITNTINYIESSDLKSMYEEFSKKSIEEIDKNSKWYSELLQNPIDDLKIHYAKLALNHIGIGKKPDAYNYGINDGFAAGRTVHHLHIHVIPRYLGDVKDPTAGIRNMFGEIGNYKNIKL